MKNILIFLILFIFISAANAATVYKWIDRQGVVNYTDDYSKILPRYRKQVEVKEFTPERSSPSLTADLAPGIAPQNKEERRDRYGMSEDYWRDRARPWNKQLKEATSNIEAVDNQIEEKVAGLSGRFLSRTQINFFTSELQYLREEKSKYEAQANEAKEKLNELAEEAREAQANPEWIK
jgi:hypothetical protein